MAVPALYNPDYSYSAWQASNPTKPLPAPRIDNDFANISRSINETIVALSNIRRSDGKLQNGIVTADSLATSLLLGVKTPVEWEAGYSYEIADTVYIASGVTPTQGIYRATVAHISTMFASDLAADKWELVFDLSMTAIDAAAAAAAASAASASAVSAESSEAAAETAASSAEIARAAAEEAAAEAAASALLLLPSVVDIREFGALKGGPDCSNALQLALNAAAVRNQMVYIPAGYWHFTNAGAIANYPLACPGIRGEGDASCLILTANRPIISAVANTHVANKVFANFRVTGIFDGAASYSLTRFMKITGTASFGYSRFREVYFESLFTPVEIDTDPVVTSYGLESQSGWNKFENCTFWYGSRQMQWGILFKRGSSTGNSFPNCQAACAGAVLRYEGVGCVVGDIIYDGDHLGEGYIASFGPGIVYNRSMVFDAQVDAGSNGPLIFDAGQTVAPNNIKARGSFGGSQQWANVPPLRHSHIDDLGHSRWAAGGKIYNIATSGAQLLYLWDIEIGLESGCEITVMVDGTLGGVEAGYTKRVFKATRLGGDARVIPLAETQMAGTGGIPAGWPTLSVGITGAHVVIQLAFTPNGAVSKLHTNIVVEGGAHRVYRVGGTVEL